MRTMAQIYADADEGYTDFEDTKWGSADGRSIKIKDMANDHLVNVLNWVHERLTRYPDQFYESLEAVAESRRVLAFAKNEPYPVKDGDRWFLKNPESGEKYIAPPPEGYKEAVEENLKRRKASLEAMATLADNINQSIYQEVMTK